MPSRSVVVLSTFLSLVSCRVPPAPRFFVEAPLGSGAWREVATLPAWADAGGRPPLHVGYIRVVMESRSNLRSIAAAGSTTPRQRVAAVATRLRLRLGAVLDAAQVDDVAARLEPRLVLVERACRDEVLTTRPVPGNTMSTVWGLHEVPTDDLLSLLPTRHRDAVVAALRTR